MNAAGRHDRPARSFDEALEEFGDESRRAEASRSRRQLGDEAVVGGLSGTFLGTLTEVAETGAPVVLVMRSGAHHRGRVVAVGIDVVALATDLDGRRVLLNPAAIEGVRESGQARTRTVADIDGGPELAAILDEFGSERARVAIVTAGGNRLMGEIVQVGQDQITLRLDGEHDSMTMPLQAIDEAVIEP